MKTLQRLFISLTLVFSAFSLIKPSSVEAGTATSNGYVSGVYYTSTKKIDYYASQWWATVKSQTQSPIGLLGYSWWTIKEQCKVGTTWVDKLVQQYNPGPGNPYSTNSSSYTRQYQGAYQTCSTQRRWINQGNHDYSHNSSHIFPYLELVE